MSSEKFLPWSDVRISNKNRWEVNKALSTNWISGGNYLQLFSQEIKNFLGSKNSVFIPTSSGTTALETILIALKFLYGKFEVVIPAYGFMAAANLASQLGLKVKFADINPKTWCVDKKSIQKVITNKTKLLIIIHNYGNLSDVSSIKGILPDKCLILEDCAEALGSKFLNCHAGTLAQFSTFSFHATKLITTGEGGGILVNDSNYVEICQLIISHGLKRKIDYYHELPGKNFRMSNINASLGYSQLQKINSKIANVVEIYNYYKKILNSNKSIDLQEISEKISFVPWSLPIFLKEASAVSVKSKMFKKGIETRTGFLTPKYLPYFGHKYRNRYSDLLSSHIINLPLYPSLRKRQIKYICENFNEITLNN